MELVVWYGFDTRLCKSEFRKIIHCFMQVPFKYKFRRSIHNMIESFFSLQKHPIPLQKESQKTKLHISTSFDPTWLSVNNLLFGQMVDQSQLTILYSICFMFEPPHHVQVLFNTTSRVVPAKTYQKAYTQKHMISCM